MRKIITILAVVLILVLGFILIHTEPAQPIKPYSSLPLTEADAISHIQEIHAELKDYPSDNLPPKRIQTELLQNGTWLIGFLSLGSGRPGILQATCYSINPAKEVVKTGEFKAGTQDSVERLRLANCTAAK